MNITRAGICRHAVCLARLGEAAQGKEHRAEGTEQKPPGNSAARLTRKSGTLHLLEGAVGWVAEVLSYWVVAVNEDAPADQAKVKPFIKRKRYGFTVTFDEDRDLWRQFNLDALPTVILLDRDGKVAYSHTGHKPGDEAELVTRIESLFERESPP